MKKTALTLSIIFVISAASSFAGTVYGTVKDEDGKAIAGAEVKIYGKDIKAKSDEKGNFKIVSENLIDGNRYSVKVNAKGYDTGQTLSTEVFDDPEEMEPLDVVVYKEVPMPDPVPAPTGMVQNIGNQPYEIINVTEEIEEEMLIPEEKSETKPEETKPEAPKVEKKAE
ncbi:carboxypeptidase regulatory-like domain-containing protein [bacterium]|nr:carboxypeptidase regulatory-like domain-containing protein [bacterium]